MEALHLDELAPPRQQIAQRPRVLVGQLANPRADGSSEGSQDQRIDAVGLGQTAAGLGVVAREAVVRVKQQGS